MAQQQAPLITGERLLLRRWSRGDGTRAHRWPQTDQPVHWRSIAPSSGQQTRESFAVVLLDGSLTVGRITLRDRDNNNQARLGIFLHPGHVRRGYGSESLALFCSYIARELRSLVLDVAVDNEAARRCFERVGFELVNTEYRAGFAYLEMRHDLLSPGSDLACSHAARVCSL